METGNRGEQTKRKCTDSSTESERNTGDVITADVRDNILRATREQISKDITERVSSSFSTATNAIRSHMDVELAKHDKRFNDIDKDILGIKDSQAATNKSNAGLWQAVRKINEQMALAETVLQT